MKHNKTTKKGYIKGKSSINNGKHGKKKFDFLGQEQRSLIYNITMMHDRAFFMFKLIKEQCFCRFDGRISFSCAPPIFVLISNTIC